MTCNEIKELTVPYLELDLEPSSVRDVTAHLDGCAGCRAEMEAVRQVLVRVKGMAVPDPGERFWKEFPNRVRREMERFQSPATALTEPSRHRRSWSEAIAAKWTLALAASVLLVAGVWVLRSQLDEATAPAPSVQTADLSAVVDADWHDYWEDDPDTVLVEMAGQLDRQTLDRLLAGI